jgi:hypothetical protein
LLVTFSIGETKMLSEDALDNLLSAEFTAPDGLVKCSCSRQVVYRGTWIYGKLHGTWNTGADGSVKVYGLTFHNPEIVMHIQHEAEHTMRVHGMSCDRTIVAELRARQMEEYTSRGGEITVLPSYIPNKYKDHTAKKEHTPKPVGSLLDQAKKLMGSMSKEELDKILEQLK